MERITIFNYLGSLVTENLRCNGEIKIRVRVGTGAFCNMKRVLTDKYEVDDKNKEKCDEILNMVNHIVWGEEIKYIGRDGKIDYRKLKCSS